MSPGEGAAERRGVATPPASRDEAPSAESAIAVETKEQQQNGENTPKSDDGDAILVKAEIEGASTPDPGIIGADTNGLIGVGDLEPLPESLQTEDVAMMIDALPQPPADPEQVLSTNIVPLGTDPASLAADAFNFALPQPSTPVQPILPLQPHDSITPLALNNGSVPGSAHDPMMSTPFAASPLPMAEPEAPRIQAFAKLEFDDGQFYMNTYSVLLGRDIRAARIAHQSSKNEDDGDDNDASNEAPASSRHRRVGSSRIAGSAVSESGGIIGEDDRHPKRRSRRSSRRSKSSDSVSHAPLSRKNSNLPASMLNDYQSMVRPSSGNVHPVNPSALLPSPDECPLIPIHPPATGTGGHKGISRKHARIKYNFETNAFEVEILGKNGVFVDDHWFAAGDTRPLHSGSYIQIGGVGVRFILPDIPVSDPVMSLPGEDDIYGYDEDDALDVDDSVDFDDDSDDSPDNENENEVDDNEEEDNEDREGDDEDEEDEEEEEDDEEEEATQEPEPPKKRGPGRPPKNGISRREMAERARAEKIRLTLTVNPPKNKVGRPRKYPRAEELPQKPEKRKYTRRNLEEKNGRPTTAKKEKVGAAKPQLKRPLKPPRSPSPEFDESQLTPEQLLKPQSSYVVLIYEAISNSKTGAMSLPQIYRAIERKYPFFKLRVQTNGWQSSVRHNLSQHPAFCKIERDGKGWMWGLVPDVSIEKERKRKSSPSRDPPQYQSRPSGQFQKASESLGQTAPARHGMSGQSSLPPSGGQRVTGILPAKFVNSSSQVMGGFRTANSPATLPKAVSSPAPHSTYYGNARGIQQNSNSNASHSRQDAEMALNREINKSVIAFQTKLTESLLKNGVHNAKDVVQSGVDRALGNASSSTTPGGEHPQERNITQALQSLIMQIRQKHAPHLGGKASESLAPTPVAPAPAKPQPVPAARPAAEPAKNPAAQSQLLSLLTAIGKGKRVGTPPTNGNGIGKAPPAASFGQKRGIESVDSGNGELRQSKRIAVEQESSK